MGKKINPKDEDLFAKIIHGIDVCTIPELSCLVIRPVILCIKSSKVMCKGENKVFFFFLIELLYEFCRKILIWF